MTLTEYLKASKINTDIQYYYDITLQCVPRSDYDKWLAKLFILNGNRGATIWIPNRHLRSDGTLYPGEDIDYVLRSERNRKRCLAAGINLHKFDRVHDMYPRRRGNREWDDWTEWGSRIFSD